MFLLDTNVVSELRRAKPHGGVLSWIASVAEQHVFISAVTVGEIQAGIELTRAQDPARAASLDHWLDQVAAHYKTLPMDGAAFRLWGRLMAGKSPTLAQDAMIAATAQRHHLKVVTRNTKDFSHLGVELLNPFTERPVA